MNSIIYLSKALWLSFTTTGIIPESLLLFCLSSLSKIVAVGLACTSIEL